MQQCAGVARRPLPAQAHQVPVLLLLMMKPIFHPAMFCTLINVPKHFAGMSAASRQLAMGFVGIQQGQVAAASPAFVNKLRQGHLPVLRAPETLSIGTFLGGLEIWDRRRSGKPQLRSPISWGITGSGALDAAQVRALLERGLPPFCISVQSRQLCAESPIQVSAEAVRPPGASHPAQRWMLHEHCTQQPAGLCPNACPACDERHRIPHAWCLVHRSCTLCKQMPSGPPLPCIHSAFFPHEEQC